MKYNQDKVDEATRLPVNAIATTVRAGSGRCSAKPDITAYMPSANGTYRNVNAGFMPIKIRRLQKYGNVKTKILNLKAI